MNTRTSSSDPDRRLAKMEALPLPMNEKSTAFAGTEGVFMLPHQQTETSKDQTREYFMRRKFCVEILRFGCCCWGTKFRGPRNAKVRASTHLPLSVMK